MALEYLRGYVLFFAFFLLFAAWYSIMVPAKVWLRINMPLLILGIVAGTFHMIGVMSYDGAQRHLLMESLWHNGFWNSDFPVIKISMSLIIIATAVQVYLFNKQIITVNLRFLQYIRNNYSHLEMPLVKYRNRSIILAPAFTVIAFLTDALLFFNSSIWVMILYSIYQFIYIYIVLFYVFDLNQYKKIESHVTIYFKEFLADAHEDIYTVYFPNAEISEQDVLSNAKRTEIHRNIMAYFIDSKPYLTPKLTMNDIAKALNTNRTYISQVINGDFGTDFYNFVNVFRIEEAKVKMKKNPNYSLTFIAEDSGFGSYTTFAKYYKIYSQKSADWYTKFRIKSAG